MITRRLVCLFPGFEPMRADAHIKRFRRGAECAAALWDLAIGIEQPADNAGPHSLFPRLRVRTGGGATGNPPWRTDTEIVIFDWGDLILAYGARPVWKRLATGYLGLADVFASGTAFRYFRISWRYGLFYLFPILILFGAGGLGLLLGSLAKGLAVNLGPLAAAAIGIATGLIVLGGLLFLAQRRLHLLTALDDWAMARDICRDRNLDIRNRIALQARQLATCFAEAGADPDTEVVVAAHSLGAVMAVSAMAQALQDNAGGGPQPHILTVGSSLMKTALHPAARQQRTAVKDLTVKHKLPWTDCQALSDPINFYKSNPTASLGIEDARTPRVVRVHFKKLVKPDTYKRIKRDFFRLHRQFVLPVERRAPYSFHLLLIGPNRLARFAYDESVDVPPLKAQPGPPKDISANAPNGEPA
ncbi:hypothetical protein LQ948_14725 [Jiella sp. MQZ9-1]|uniref:Fungal lipase-like domain-containing protein n=1 Tax=Jiella flava TaxID=2816857 RepID=A0A939JTD8_9HYPH|nr:hypothetical protein [Jiella flava]MBO0663888.1 hypothetical protein [Jiella flava]MCD2472460.1 hypothetical protein [Jiella flava]